MQEAELVRVASRAAYLIAAAGAFALVSIGLFFAGIGAFGTLNDLSLLVMTLALAPVMLGFYTLGGRTPLRPAQLALASGTAAVILWSVLQAMMIVGVVTFDYEHAATGAFAGEAIALVAMGSWLGGASLLAGAWLSPPLRWTGATAGLAFIVFAGGLLLGGVNHPLTYVGGIGYQIVFPAWAFFLGRLFAGVSPSPLATS